ncbi:MAG: hypothetical protein IJI37_04610 [Opitutales bacterium]|nr:hypothetical protein [Opitutales bacterium]
MKNLILVLLLAAIGAFYYYEKRGKEGARTPAAAVSAQDPRAAEVEARAKELFPTKIDDRNSWIASQLAAMAKLDKKPDSVSDREYSEILAAAKSKFGADYSRSLRYVSDQCAAAADIAEMRSKSSLSNGEQEAILARLREAHNSDRAAVRDALARVFENYGLIKSKSTGMSRKDFETLSKKTIPILAGSPNEAVAFFEKQALARHNFLSKGLPKNSENVRAEIEAKYPGDFAAQLAALDAYIDSSIRTRKTIDFSAAQKMSELGENLFKKRIYALEAKSGSFCVCFAMMNGKKVALFPSPAMGGEESFSLDVGGGERLASGNVFMSRDSAFAVVVADGESPFPAVDVLPKADAFANAGELKVSVVGMDRSGKKSDAKGVLYKSGKLELERSAGAAEKFSGGALVADEASGKIVALLEIRPDADIRFIAESKSPEIGDLLGRTERARFWKGLDAAVSRAGAAAERKPEIAAVFPEDIKAFSKFDAKKYARQMEAVKSACEANLGALGFMLCGNYATDAETPALADTARKYRAIFVTGSRCSLPILYANFSRYIQSARSDLRSKAAGAIGASDFYYDFAEPAKRQAELFAALEKPMLGAVASGDIAAVLHWDIASAISGGSYVPPGRDFAVPAKGGGNSAVLRLGNKGKKN